MRVFVALLLALSLCGNGLATSVAPRSLKDLVADSDHVIVATVANVDMIDGKGQPVRDDAARTGPGFSNEIRLHLEVREVLFTRRSAGLPRQVVVPLWQAWHYSLGAIRNATTGATSIFLLKGDGFIPTYPAGFQRSLSEKDEIARLIDQLLRKQ